jgi:hypothetical protein
MLDATQQGGEQWLSVTVFAIMPKTKKKEKPGPKPEVLKVNGDWRDAVKRSLNKKKPATGWPKE